MRLRILLVCCAALALTVGITTATAGGGNSEAAKACQKDGWKNLMRADGSAFKNEGDCVSYAATGETLTTKPQEQRDCESFGGTFVPGGGHGLWSCNGWFADSPGLFDTREAVIRADCPLVSLRTSPSGVASRWVSVCSSVGG